MFFFLPLCDKPASLQHYGVSYHEFAGRLFSKKPVLNSHGCTIEQELARPCQPPPPGATRPAEGSESWLAKWLSRNL